MSTIQAYAKHKRLGWVKTPCPPCLECRSPRHWELVPEGGLDAVCDQCGYRGCFDNLHYVEVDMCRHGKEVSEQLYRFAWKNNPVRARLYCRTCRLVARGSMNTVLVEFVDTNERVTTSGNALRKVQR